MFTNTHDRTPMSSAKKHLDNASLTLNQTVFREYDIRGIFGSDLTPKLANEIGLAIGTYIKRRGGNSIAVGRDCRLSGEILKQAFSKGLSQTGVQITDIGIAPTPVLYWAIEHYGLDAGVQITGSHNPTEYNGFKITAFKHCKTTSKP